MHPGGKKTVQTVKSNSSKDNSSGKLHLAKFKGVTLGNGNLQLAVTLPEGEDLNEWLAVNTVDFYNQIHMLYGSISEFCTNQRCPLMTAGPKFEYYWSDGTKNSKLKKLSAPEYVESLMNWIQGFVDDENVFPCRIGAQFPPNFQSIVKQIFKRLFRVYGHIYHSHFSIIVQLGEEPHLNTSFKHFIYFIQEFDLVEKKELSPLSELIEILCN